MLVWINYFTAYAWQNAGEGEPVGERKEGSDRVIKSKKKGERERKNNLVITRESFKLMCGRTKSQIWSEKSELQKFPTHV